MSAPQVKNEMATPEELRLIPTGPASFKLIVSVILLGFTWWGLYLIILERGFNEGLWLLSEESCSGVPGLCGFKLAGYLLSVVFIFPHLGEADLFRKAIGPAAVFKGFAAPNLMNFVRWFGVDADRVIIQEMKFRLIKQRSVLMQILDGIAQFIFFLGLVPFYVVVSVVVLLTVVLGFPLLLVTGQIQTVRKLKAQIASNFASVACAMDQFLTSTLLVLSYAIILTSEGVADVIVNVVAVIIFAELDDELVEMFYHRLGRMKDKLELYKILDEDEDLEEVFRSEMERLNVNV